MKKKSLIVSFVLVVFTLFAGGYYGFNKYQETKKIEEQKKFTLSVIEQIIPFIKNTNIRVSSCLKVEVEDEKITWAGYFEKLKKNTDEIEENILKIKTIENEKNKHIITPYMLYIYSCKKLLVSMNSEVKDRFDVSSARKRVDEQASELRNETNSMSRDMHRKWLLKADDELQKEIQEHRKSLRDYEKSLKDTKELALKISFENKEVITLINQHLIDLDSIYIVSITTQEIEDLDPTRKNKVNKMIEDSKMMEKYNKATSEKHTTLSLESCAKKMNTTIENIKEMGEFISVFSQPDGEIIIDKLSPGVSISVIGLEEPYYRIVIEDRVGGWIHSEWIEAVK